MLGLTCQLQRWIPGGSLLEAVFLGVPDAQPPAGLGHSFTMAGVVTTGFLSLVQALWANEGRS